MKNKRKTKKGVLWLKFVLISILFVVTAALFAFSPLFNIRRIEIQGNRRCKKEDIIASTGSLTGNNGFKTIGSSIGDILLLRYGNVEKTLLKNYPYIKNVTVKYIIPDTVRISITERKPMGIIPYLGVNLLVDSEGYVLDAFNKEENINLPFIKGLKFERFELGQALIFDNPEKLRKAIEVLEAIEYFDKSDSFKILNVLNYVDAGDLRKICLYIDSRILVNFGDLQDLNYRISFFKEIYFKKMKKDERGYLDFTTGENPDFIPER